MPDTLYSLDTAARTWRALGPTQVQGTAPTTTVAAAMAADGDRLYLFGGVYRDSLFTPRKRPAACDRFVACAAAPPHVAPFSHR